MITCYQYSEAMGSLVSPTVANLHIEAFKPCGYPNWTFVKTSNRSRRKEEKEKWNNIVIPRHCCRNIIETQEDPK